MKMKIGPSWSEARLEPHSPKMRYAFWRLPLPTVEDDEKDQSVQKTESTDYM